MNKNCPKFFHWKHVLPTQSERMMHLRKYWKISEMFKILANINLFRCRLILKILKNQKKTLKNIRNIKNICKYKSLQVPTDLTVSSSSSSAARAQNGLQAENRFSCWLLPSSIIVLATILIIPSVIHILIITRLAQQTAFWVADYLADHNYHYYHHYYCQ